MKEVLLKNKTREEIKNMVPFMVCQKDGRGTLESYLVKNVSDKGISLSRKEWRERFVDPEDDGNPFAGGEYLAKTKKLIPFDKIDDTWVISEEATGKQREFIRKYCPNIYGETICKYHASVVISKTIEQWNVSRKCRLADMEDYAYEY